MALSLDARFLREAFAGGKGKARAVNCSLTGRRPGLFSMGRRISMRSRSWMEKRASETTTFPRRIVCLTEETVEVLYLLGEQDRIVGVSGFACRPREAREKPRVSAFITAKIDRIVALEPDLVVGFSNLQGDIARDLIRAGVNTLVFNQRSVEEIFRMILLLSRIVGAEEKGLALCAKLRVGLGRVQESARRFSRRPRVFFEEWMDPLIGGIRWVEELIEIAGRQPVLPDLRREEDAARRCGD